MNFAVTIYKGSIWVWDMAAQQQLAEIRSHSDVVHDICVVGTALYSCALDQTIAVLNLHRMEQKLKRKKRTSKKLLKLKESSSSSLKKADLKKVVNVNQAVVIKAHQIERNDKYAYWVLDSTEDGSTLVAGSRKVNIWKPNKMIISRFGPASRKGSSASMERGSSLHRGDSLQKGDSLHYERLNSLHDDDSKGQDDGPLGKGPVVGDTDVDHIQSLQVRMGQIVICRREVPRAKIFSADDGTEIAKSKYKTPVKRVQFTFDSQHCVVCCQKDLKPPTMHLWNIKK